MSKQVVKIEDLKIENIIFSQIKVNNRGGKVVYINYNYEDGSAPKKLRIQFPKMKCPFSITGFDALAPTKDEKGKISLSSNDSIELSFDETTFILEKVKQIEGAIFQFALKNSKSLLGKEYNKDFIEEFRVSNIRISTDKDGSPMKYPPRLRCKLSKDENGVYTTSFFDNSRKKLECNYINYREVIPKMSDCLTIVDLSSIWVVGQKFGASFRPVQMKVFKNEMSLEEYAFVEDTQDSEDELVKHVIKDMDSLEVEESEEDPLDA